MVGLVIEGDMLVVVVNCNFPKVESLIIHDGLADEQSTPNCSPVQVRQRLIMTNARLDKECRVRRLKRQESCRIICIKLYLPHP